MNTGLKLMLLSVAASLALHAGRAGAVVYPHMFSANAVDYCQAFTPGPANTIRNRVIGAENVGTAPINVACDFHTMFNGTGSPNPTFVAVYFSNNSANAITINCTLLTSYQGGTGYAVAKSVDLPPHQQNFKSVEWSGADNPGQPAGGTDLGDSLVGVNCLLPPGGVINDTYLLWNQDNGV
jgi:hypothetical protein